MRSLFGMLLCALLALASAQSINQSINQLIDGRMHLSNFSQSIVTNQYFFTLPLSNQSISQSVDDFIYELTISVNSYVGDADVTVFRTNNQSVSENQSINQSINQFQDSEPLWTSYQQTSSVILIHQSELLKACDNQSINESINCTFAINVHGAGFHSIIVTAFANNQSVNQPDNQSINQSIDQSIIRLNHPYHWPINGKVSHHDGVAIYRLRQPANQTINQSINQSISHWSAVISPTYGNPELIITTIDNLENALSLYQSIKNGDFDQYHGHYDNSINQSIWFTTPYDTSVDQSINQSINSGILTVRNTAVGYCFDCDYVVIVYTRAHYSTEYLLSFYAPIYQSLNQSINQSIGFNWLIQNQPLLRTARFGDTHRYQTLFLNTGNDRLSIAMTRMIGNVSMIIYQSDCQSINQSINQNLVFDSKLEHTHIFVNQSINQSISVTPYCMVINAHSNSSYTVITSTINQSINQSIKKPIRLIDGLPQEDSINESGRFYLVSLPINQSISYSLSRRFGDFLLYNCGKVNQSVSQSINQSINECELLVTGHGLGAYSSNRKSGLIDSGHYLIGVFPRSVKITQSINQSIDQSINQSIDQSVELTFTATMGNSAQRLRANVPVPAIIAGQSINQSITNSSYYVFHWPYEINQSINQSRFHRLIDLVFHVTVFTGHVTLYASDSGFSGPNHYNWTSHQSINQSTNQSIDQSIGTIIIPARQLRRGHYFITAVAAHEATFAITAIAPVIHHYYNQSINQSMNQPISQPIDQSINQPVNKGPNQSINQPVTDFPQPLFSYAEKFGVQLRAGLPFNAHVQPFQMEYFTLIVPISQISNITVTLTPIKGRAYLYVNKDGVFPSPINQSTWSAHSTNNQSAIQAVFLPHSIWCQPINQSINRCRYVIAVQGVSFQSAYYQLQANLPHSTSVLQVGVPQIHSIGRLLNPSINQSILPGRFQFYVPNNSTNVTISITTVNPGLVENSQFNQSSLFVSRHPYNVSTNPEWALINQLTDPSINQSINQSVIDDRATIFIDPNDSHFEFSGQRGYYWAEVRGPVNMIYTLALSMNHFVPSINRSINQSINQSIGEPSKSQLGYSSMVMLIDGQHQRRSVYSDGSHPAIFKFEVTSSINQSNSTRGSFRLVAECLTGGPVEMYARNDGRIPTDDPTDRRQYYANSISAVTSMRVPYILPHWDNATHSWVNMTNDWLIRVQARDADHDSDFTTFSMLGSSQFDRLIDGEPEVDLVLRGHTGLLFSFTVNHPVHHDYLPLFIDLTVQSGSATLYATNDLTATLDTLPTHFNQSTSWQRAQKLDGRNSVFRQTVQPGRWQIAIINDNPSINRSIVSLVATSRESIRLIDCMTQSVSIDSGNGSFTDHMMFRYDYNNIHNSTFIFRLTTVDPRTYLGIYATFDGSRPSINHNHWNSSTADVDSMTRNMVLYIADRSRRPASLNGDYEFLSKTVIHILVQVEQSVGFVHIPFTVVGTTQKNSTFVDLSDGIDSGPQFMITGRHRYRHFTFEHRESLPVAFTISKQHGSLGMYISTPAWNTSLWPNETMYEYDVFVNTTETSGHLSVNITRPGMFRITVMNMNVTELAMFSVLAFGQRSGDFIDIGGEDAVGGFCTIPSAAFRLPVPDITNDVHIHIRPSNHASFQYSHGLFVRISRSPNMHINETLMVIPTLYWNESLDLMANSEHLHECTYAGTRSCVLYLTIDCVRSDVQVDFTVIAQRDGDVMPLNNMDYVPPMHVTQSKSANFVVLLPNNANPLRVVAWPCYGRPFLFMSQNVRYPTQETAEYSSTRSDTINRLDLPASIQPIRGSQWYTAVRSSGVWDSYFALEIINADPIQYEPLIKPLSTAIHLSNLGVGGSLDLTWEPSRINTIWAGSHDFNNFDVRYEVYVSTIWAPPAVLWTRCGLEHIGALQVLQLSNSTLVINDDGLFVAQIHDLDSSQTYAVTIVAVVIHKYNETKHGYAQFAYDFSTLRPAQPTHDPEHSTSHTGEILAAVFVPLFVLSGLIAVWYYRKNKRIQQEYALEMPDVESMDVTPSAVRRRGGQHDRYASLVENDSLGGRL